MVTYDRSNTKIARADLSRVLNSVVWAADNGCFTNPNLDVPDYLRWLEERKAGLPRCLFAVAPDVVANAEATWERSLPVLPVLRNMGFQAAFVAQDGQEKLPMLWHTFDCLFIGGSTKWKLSENAFQLCMEAKKRGKWVHMGRVNSRKRLRVATLALCDSSDGTHLCFGPDKRTPQLVGWLNELAQQPFLPFGGVEAK